VPKAGINPVPKTLCFNVCCQPGVTDKVHRTNDYMLNGAQCMYLIEFSSRYKSLLNFMMCHDILNGSGLNVDNHSLDTYCRRQIL
jgi:hypothetical protein